MASQAPSEEIKPFHPAPGDTSWLLSRILVATPRLLVRRYPGPFRNPPKSVVKREAGHQQPTSATGENRLPPFPRRPGASSGRRPTATLATRDVPTRERRHPDRGTRRDRRRRRSLRDTDQARRGAELGSCGVPGGVAPGDGAGTNMSASLRLLSSWRRGRATDSARERSFFHLTLGTEIGGTGPAFRKPEGRSDDKTGPTIPTTNPT
jgi:hypothetical protein